MGRGNAAAKRGAVRSHEKPVKSQRGKAVRWLVATLYWAVLVGAKNGTMPTSAIQANT
jgi:hypothetical protein